MKPEIHAPKRDEKPSFIQLMGSVLSAAVGIQSRKKRERDFKYGKASPFVIAGVIATVLFVVTVFAVVHFVLKQVGS